MYIFISDCFKVIKYSIHLSSKLDLNNSGLFYATPTTGLDHSYLKENSKYQNIGECAYSFKSLVCTT